VCLFAAIALLAMAATDVVGTWDCISTTEDGSQSRWKIKVDESGGRLSGRAAGERGEYPLRDVSFTQGILTFKITLDMVDYSVKAKVEANKLDGTWSGGGETGSLKGTR
jgi:hypothetical protein